MEATVETFRPRQTPGCAPSSRAVREDQPREGGDLGVSHHGMKKPRAAHYTRVREFGQSRFVEVDLADVPDVRRTGV